MNHPGSALQRELLARCPYISILAPVAHDVTVHLSDQHITPYIKLPPIIQEGIINILLDDECPSPLIGQPSRPGHDVPDGVQILAKLDATASIGVLSWFDNPCVSALLAFG